MMLCKGSPILRITQGWKLRNTTKVGPQIGVRLGKESCWRTVVGSWSLGSPHGGKESEKPYAWRKMYNATLGKRGSDIQNGRVSQVRLSTGIKFSV